MEAVPPYAGMVELVDTSGLSPDCYEQCEFESRCRYYFFIKGDIQMKGMTGIYKINPALFGGIMALFVELIITMILPL